MKNISSWLLQQLMSDTAQQRATLREFAPGESIFRVGDSGDYLAVLLVGSIEIRKGARVLSIVAPGSMFGEMGIIDNQPRVADAVAKSHCRVAEIREGQFMGLMEATPYFGLALMRLLTERLRQRIET